MNVFAKLGQEQSLTEGWIMYLICCPLMLEMEEDYEKLFEERELLASQELDVEATGLGNPQSVSKVCPKNFP